MKFEESKGFENLGKRAGYVLGYFLFTTVLYFILKALNKLPSNWGYVHVMWIVLVIALIGAGIKRGLK